MYSSESTIGCLRVVFLLLLVVGCAGDGTEGFHLDGDLDMGPFIEYAGASDCTDIRNRLFVIDDELVLWDRAGSCADASYEIQLFAETLDNLLCEDYDTIAGPVRDIYGEAYRELFETIVENIDDGNLGLGVDHLVEEIVF